MAVVDSTGKVFGVSRLRVADISAFPLLPPGHPQATVCECFPLLLARRSLFINVMATFADCDLLFLHQICSRRRLLQIYLGEV